MIFWFLHDSSKPSAHCEKGWAQSGNSALGSRYSSQGGVILCVHPCRLWILHHLTIETAMYTRFSWGLIVSHHERNKPGPNDASLHIIQYNCSLAVHFRHLLTQTG